MVSGPLIVVSITLLIIAYLTGHYNYANYLNLFYVKETGEIVVYLAAVIGALIDSYGLTSILHKYLWEIQGL